MHLRFPAARFAAANTAKRALSSLPLYRPSATFPNQSKGDLKWDRYVTFKPETALTETTTLLDFSSLHLDENENWKRINVESEHWEDEFLDIVTLPRGVPNETEDVLYRDTLFIRSDYIGVFTALLKQRKSVIVGSPSVGKSWLQWISIFFFANPSVLKQLTVDENLMVHKPPKIVIRFVVQQPKFTVWFMEEKIVHELPHDQFDNVCKMFDCEDTLLLWKPDETYKAVVPAFVNLTEMRIWAASFPFDNRNRLFCSQGGVKVYLPCPSREELFAMAEHLKHHESTLRSALHFDRDDVEKRLYKYGPFIHCVLPTNVDDLLKIEKDRSRAIDGLSKAERLKLMSKQSIEASGNEVQLWLQRFAVDPYNKDAYFKPSVVLKVASEQLQNEARTYAETMSEAELQKLLGSLNENGSNNSKEDWMGKWF